MAELLPADSLGEGFSFNQWYLFNSQEEDGGFPHFCRDPSCQPCVYEARRQWRECTR